jgi:hypothetical protein
MDEKQNKIILKSKSGEILWRGTLVVEDESGENICSLNTDYSGQAKDWKSELSFSSTNEDIDILNIDILPIRGMRLKRIFLRLEGGKDAVPPFKSSDTRMLGSRGGTFGENGILRLETDDVTRSFLITILYHPEHKYSLLFGIGGIPEDFSYFQADKQYLTAGFNIDREIIKPEKYSLAFGANADPFKLLDDYGDYMAKFARPSCAPQTGWNSWDYYGAAVSMNSVRDEMAAINTSFLKDKLKYIVLDFGWEQAWGEWNPNSRFPSEYLSIAQEIESAGFVPGIWVAPLQAHIFSLLGRHQQDMLLKSPAGSPITVDQHALLDFTLSEVQDILGKWFTGMREAGFRLFKLDYIYKSYLDAVELYYDNTRGKAGFVRKGLEIIRDAVGDDSHIINCGAPVESALGIADSSRMTTDIHTFWGHIKNNARQLSAKLWQNDKLWRIDPDFAVIRSSETTDDPFPNYIYKKRPLLDGQSYWMAGPEATYSELLVWLTQVYLSAGNLFLSDSLKQLNKKGFDTLIKLFPPLEESARPLDMFVNPIPRFWYAKSGNLLGVFNWEDQETPIIIPAGIHLPSQGIDVWTGEKKSISSSKAMPPRSSWLLRL